MLGDMPELGKLKGELFPVSFSNSVISLCKFYYPLVLHNVKIDTKVETCECRIFIYSIAY